MSFRAVVAAPFRQRGADRLTENAFVVSLSLDRDWFTPDQAARVADLATGRGLLDREGEELVATFDPETVEIPTDFEPDPSLLRTPSPFEQVLEALIEAGHEKQAAVAGINQVQADLAITVEAAAVCFARRNGLDVSDIADAARAEA